MYNKRNSRKYQLVWGVIIIATMLCLLGKISGETWAMATGGITGWYFKVNLEQKKAFGGTHS